MADPDQPDNGKPGAERRKPLSPWTTVAIYVAGALAAAAAAAPLLGKWLWGP